MVEKSKYKHALKAAFSTANLNGTAAVLMSLAMGAWPATLLYMYAVGAGAYNKYRSLKNVDAPEQAPPGFVARILRDPSITARILMAAAIFNFGAAGFDLVTGPAEDQVANALRMVGWSFGFFGDNALRRLDSVNFQKGRMLGRANGSRLYQAFNALTSNPTIFYNGASMAFTFSALSKQHMGLFSTWEGGLGVAALGLIVLGTAHALRRTRQANQGTIAVVQINDGVMNYCASAAKAMQAVVAVMTGYYPLAAAQTIFTGSNIKLIFETREALGKNAEDKIPQNKPE